MTNLNIIVKKPISGNTFLNTETKKDILISDVVISPLDVVELNISLDGFVNPSAVSISLSFENGEAVNDLYLANSSTYTNLFTLSLTEVITNNLNYGEKNIVTIKDIKVTDELNKYSCPVWTDSSPSPYKFKLYKSNASDTFTPTNLEQLYISINEINQRLNNLGV